MWATFWEKPFCIDLDISKSLLQGKATKRSPHGLTKGNWKKPCLCFALTEIWLVRFEFQVTAHWSKEITWCSVKKWKVKNLKFTNFSKNSFTDEFPKNYRGKVIRRMWKIVILHSWTSNKKKGKKKNLPAIFVFRDVVRFSNLGVLGGHT